MGVCKCKQRNVTNQFCYVCRMNVCESCIVKDHERCVIKSYVHWLQDSDYSTNCQLCLEDISKGEVLRLSCYDLFHWNCLNKWALDKPDNTASAGYQCPDCKAGVFPPAALVSPVADVVRKKLATVGWGRRGLGMAPLPVSNKIADAVKSNQVQEEQIVELSSTPLKLDAAIPSSTPKSTYKVPSVSVKLPFTPPPQHQAAAEVRTTAVSVTQLDAPLVSAAAAMGPTYAREKYQAEAPSLPKKVFDTTSYEDQRINISNDPDEDKYKRKGLTHWVGNVLSLRKKPSKNDRVEPKLKFKRLCAFLLVVAIGFMTVVFVMSKVGSSFAGSDSMLDPRSNPMIKVQAPSD